MQLKVNKCIFCKKMILSILLFPPPLSRCLHSSVYLRCVVCRYPTFTRMEPPDTQVTTSVLALLKYHKWFKFTIVSQKNEQWRTIAEDLRMQAEMRPEFTVSLC